MHTLVHGVAAALACAWIGASASSQIQTPDWSGYPGPAVSSAGDVNGDGYDDAIVGGHGFSNPEEGEGRAVIYLGSPTGLAPEPVWEVEGNQEGAWFGRSVAGAGDVNGDGFDDVLVGVPFFDTDWEDAGSARLYLGSPTGPSTTPAWSQNGLGPTWYLGWDLAAAGDVNGDGFDDVIIGLPGAATAAVWHGNSSGALAFAWQGFESDGFDAYGNTVSGAGDVNGDGYDDVIVGAQLTTTAIAHEGRVYVYHGSSSGLSSTPSWTQDGEGDHDQFGFGIASAGDVDGDGFGDIAVASGSGVSVFRGESGNLTLGWMLTPGPGDDGFGWALSAGDVDDDGFDDLIVSAPWPHGRVAVFGGSSAGLSPAWSTAAVSFDHFGMGVGAGDFNGDGFCDMVVTDEPDEDGNGSAYGYHGSRLGLIDHPKHHRMPKVPKPRNH